MVDDLGYFGNEASNDMRKRKPMKLESREMKLDITKAPVGKMDDALDEWHIEQTGKKVFLTKSNMLKKLDVL